MTDFNTYTIQAPTAPPDPSKHVRFITGMVLGAEDFIQEFAYVTGLSQGQTRDLLGYGTVCGLAVTIENDVKGPRVVVDPGTAVNPRGQTIHVTPAQCAGLNEWLKARRGELDARLSSPPATGLTLYVTLCYRDCPTDNVPIPGEPCRDEGDMTAPSRLKDDFLLQLGFVSPDQREELALRDFVAWLRQIQFTSAPSTISLQDFITLIRQAAHLSSPPPASPPAALPDFLYGSPPSGLNISQADSCAYLQAAFRIWTTELRAYFRGEVCAGAAPDEECVLLAELQVPLVKNLANDWIVDNPANIVVDEERRPYLVHLRLLQEWLLCAPRSEIVVGGGSGIPADTVSDETAFGQAPNAGVAGEYSRADHTHGTPSLAGLAGDVSGPIGAAKVERIQNIDVDTTAPTADQVLRFQNGRWTPVDLPAAGNAPNPGAAVTPENAFGQAPNAGVAAEYSRADHTHGTPALPDLAGDVTGPIGNAVVGRIQQVNVAATPPQANQALLFQNGRWTPATLPPASGNFVGFPAGLPAYGIVAAGIVRATAPVRQPVYNDLQVRSVTLVGRAAIITVIFKGYRRPDGNFQYIVKAMPVVGKEDLPPMVVNFLRFDDPGIVLQVMQLTGEFNQNTANAIELMIEVSQYPFRP